MMPRRSVWQRTYRSALTVALAMCAIVLVPSAPSFEAGSGLRTFNFASSVSDHRESRSAIIESRGGDGV